MIEPRAFAAAPPPGTPQPAVRDYGLDDYRRFWAGPARAILHRAECSILEKILPPTSGWFLDIGCGHGRLVPTYVRPERRPVLVDYALPLLQMAADSYAGQDIEYIAANACVLPFRANTFDGGICVRTFHHMNAPQAFLNELARVLRHGAPCVLSYSNKRNLVRLVRGPSSAIRHDHEAYSATLFGTHPACLAAMARNAGLVVEDAWGTGFVDQVARATGLLDRLLGRIPSLVPPFALAERAADRVCRRLNLAPLIFVLLRKAGGAAASVGEERPASLAGLLACPSCHASAPGLDEGGCVCGRCGKRFPRRGRILDFR